MRLLTLLLLSWGLSAAGGPRLILEKSFPGSSPAYDSVTLDQSGDAEYREAADDDSPLKFHLDAEDTKEIFGLVEKLDYFKHPVESQKKVAFMGQKTFRYENGAEKGQVQFNYSENATAMELLDWFECMAESARRRIDLERAAKYDKLGVYQALSLLDEGLENDRIVALDQFLPILDRIAKNETYMHTARVLAAQIADGIRATQ
jgi:hypothetical protein